MLWVALCFPRLALEALLRGRAPFEGPDDLWAVIENRSVLVCNAAAAAALQASTRRFSTTAQGSSVPSDGARPRSRASSARRGK